MVSTHMGFGFIISYAIILSLGYFGLESTLVAPVPILILIGLLGGAFPDVDRKEEWGLHHRQTLHFTIGYGVVAVLLLVLNAFYPSPFILACSCFFAGAWLHSVMDIFGGWWITPKQSVYEHITRKWIRAFNFFPFAQEKEWSLQSFGNVIALVISPNLPPLLNQPGWLFGVGCFSIIWLLSTVYEIRITIPKRRAMVETFWKQKFSKLQES